MNLDDPTPQDLYELRAFLRGTLPVDDLCDEQLIEAMRARLDAKIPAPPVRAGSGPTNGRLWLHETLTAGGFKQPEDEHHRADLGDGGETVELGLLGLLVMRHMSGSDEPDWSDERLSRESGATVDDFRRGQALLDEVAVAVGCAASPRPRWWEDRGAPVPPDPAETTSPSPAVQPLEIVRWALLLPDSGPIIVLVVDDSDDDELAGIIASEDMVPAEHFGGVWGTAQRDGHWLVGFRLVELGARTDGIERAWITDNIHRELLETILTVPHLVAILPAELAEDFQTGEDLLPRLAGSLMVEVEDRSPQVAEVLAERGDD